MPTMNTEMGMPGQILAGYCITMRCWTEETGVRYNQSAEKNRAQDGIKARNGGTEMENTKKRLDDSFRRAKTT